MRAPEGGLRDDSVVVLDQIRSIDKRRLLRRLGRVAPETMHEVEQALLISLGFFAL